MFEGEIIPHKKSEMDSYFVVTVKMYKEKCTFQW